MVGLLFPELKDAEKYFNLGKRLLEEEAKNKSSPMAVTPCTPSTTIASSCIFISTPSNSAN
jgi:hypothetical protein